MKWGVINSKKKTGGEKAPKPKKESKIGLHLKSMKREHEWGGKLANASKMSTKDINKHASRAQAENNLKRLSRQNGVGSKKDKMDYLKREKMSDKELGRKVQRLQAKANLKRTASEATRSQLEIGKKVLSIAGPLAVQYALTKSIGSNDILKAVTNPHSAKEKAMKAVMKKLNSKG